MNFVSSRSSTTAYNCWIISIFLGWTQTIWRNTMATHCWTCKRQSTLGRFVWQSGLWPSPPSPSSDTPWPNPVRHSSIMCGSLVFHLLDNNLATPGEVVKQTVQCVIHFVVAGRSPLHPLEFPSPFHPPRLIIWLWTTLYKTFNSEKTIQQLDGNFTCFLILAYDCPEHFQQAWWNIFVLVYNFVLTFLMI